jgi:hypothetical protein
LLRVRRLYKRFFSVAWTFSITRFSTFFRKTDFFNSHRISQRLSNIQLYAEVIENRFRVADDSDLTVDECAVLQQSSPATEQFRAFRVVDLPINLDGK